MKHVNSFVCIIGSTDSDRMVKRRAPEWFYIKQRSPTGLPGSSAHAQNQAVK